MSQVGYALPVVAPARSGNGAANVGFFTEALAQNVGSAMYNIPMQVGAGAPGRRTLIRAIECITDENFGPEFNFFSRATGKTADPDTDSFISRFAFVSAMGEQINAAGLWRYYIDGLAIPYHDLDSENYPAGQVTPTIVQQKLHVVLQNVSATAKLATAAAAGRIHTTFWLEPMSNY
jgi:hypothetical protein